MKAFTVNSKDLLDNSKNPNLSLSVKDIIKNNKIRKEDSAMKTIKKIKVRNMKSNSNNTHANQFIIDTPEGQYFQSYNSIIVYENWKEHKTYLDKNNWDYSVTTGKYRNQFLGETKKDTERKIKAGIYKLVDLNWIYQKEIKKR